MSFMQVMEFLVLLVMGWLVLLVIICVVAMGVWLYALYKWITGRSKWRRNVTRKGNPRV